MVCGDGYGVVRSQVHCQGLTAILTFVTRDRTIIKRFNRPGPASHLSLSIWTRLFSRQTMKMVLGSKPGKNIATFGRICKRAMTLHILQIRRAAPKLAIGFH